MGERVRGGTIGCAVRREDGGARQGHVWAVFHRSASPGSMGFMPWEIRMAALLVLVMWQSSHLAPGMKADV